MPVYAIASGKGGVGKTTTAIALAACAGAAGESAVLVDADLGMADVATFLGLDGGPTLHDVLAGDADTEAALRSVEGFDVLPAGTDLEGYAAGDPAGLGGVLADLEERYDVILLDAGAGLSHDTVLPLGLADEVVLVSTPDEVSVVDTDKTRALAKRVGGTLRGVVLTKTVEADLADLSTGIDVPLLGVVPQDEAVGEAAAERRAVPAFAPQSPAGTAYMDIAADLFGVAVTAMDFAEGDGTAGASIEEAAVDPFPGEEAAVEESEPEDEAKDDATDRATDGSKTDATADAERDTDEESRGFFSRLFGR